MNINMQHTHQINTSTLFLNEGSSLLPWRSRMCTITDMDQIRHRSFHFCNNKNNFFITFTFTFSHLADAFVQSDVQGIEQSSYEQYRPSVTINTTLHKK